MRSVYALRGRCWASVYIGQVTQRGFHLSDSRMHYDGFRVVCMPSLYQVSKVVINRLTEEIEITLEEI